MELILPGILFVLFLYILCIPSGPQCPKCESYATRKYRIAVLPKYNWQNGKYCYACKNHWDKKLEENPPKS